MADNDWQLEAVQEQFDVFDKLSEPHSSFPAKDFGAIIKKVDDVLTQQRRVNDSQTIASRRISAELIKANQEDIICVSYVVLVTNEDVNDKLCKIPVFTVRVGNQRTFVDVSGSVYKSWDAFMKNNDLPDCQLCYPVGGCYNVGGKLKIDFARSPAANRSRTRFWLFVGGAVIGAAVIAASLYFNIAPIAFTIAGELIPIAEQFLPKILSDALRQFGPFARLCQKYRKGSCGIIGLTSSAFKLLFWFYSNFKEEIDNVWTETKKKLRTTYSYLYRIFAKYFRRASNESQNTFFANVIRVENEMVQAREEAGGRISKMTRDLISAKSPISTVGSVMIPYNRQIFQNCRTESALQNEIKTYTNEQNSCTQFQPFKPITESLLTKSKNFANTTKNVETLSDVNDIFESLSCVVKDEYQNKINNYIKGVEAAQASAENGINLDVYNNSLGIVGDPKDHFMKEAMLAVKETRLAYRLKEKIKEFRMDTRILLIPMVKASEEEDEGVYKAIGARGNGKFSAQRLLHVLVESFNGLEESELVVNETDSLIYIRSEEMSIFAYQEVNSENTSEGIVYVTRNES